MRKNLVLILAVILGLIVGSFLTILFTPDYGQMLRKLWSAIQGSYIEVVELLNSIAYLIGAAVLILLPVYLLLRLYYGKGWVLKTGIRLGAGVSAP